MACVHISGSTEITAEGIKKHFKHTEPLDALFELAWNGFDAKAKTVTISILRNDLNTPIEITVADNGDGIDYERHVANFGRFNESGKIDIGQRGSHGRGRLAFYKLAHEATWYTQTKNGQAVFRITSNDVKHYNVDILEPENTHGRVAAGESGTLVTLTKIFASLPDRTKLLQLFSRQFGWYLAFNPEKQLLVDGDPIEVPEHEIHEESIKVGNHDFGIKIIRWNDKPSSERSYTYLHGSSGRTVHRQLSTLNNKPNFYTSISVQSAWADTFSTTSSLFETNALDSDEWRIVDKRINSLGRGIYDAFLRRLVDAEIAKFEEEGVFPTYPGISKEDAEWRHENAKKLVKSIYTADPAIFNSLTKKQKKVLVRLLDRLAVSNENESILEILSGVLELEQGALDTLARQLKHTTLENIVSTIELLQRRQQAVHELRELMNVHYAKVLETPDLQKIIENNTWLFGAQYETLGAEEASFTKIAKSLRDGMKGVDLIENEDLEGEVTVEGANRQPDLFLARKFPSFDSFGKQFYRCIIIEIKRPSIALNIKHLRQLDDYATIIKKHPEFSSSNMHFELILIGRKISDSDTEIASRLKQQLSRGETGLVTDDERMKRYVLNWYTLLDGFELTNSALLSKLKLRRDELSAGEKAEIVERLQASAKGAYPQGT